MLANVQLTLLNKHLHHTLDAVSTAGLIDLDVTVVYYAGLFIALLVILPGLVFKPMLARMEQLDARTTGARANAHAIKRNADEQVASFDAAASDQKRKALEERAKLREETQKQADGMVVQARRDTQARIDAGLAAQKIQAQEARKALEADAQEIAGMIANKLAQG